MLPTPDLSHLTRRDYDEIYEPAEDTFLLLDALEADADALTACTRHVCLEVGSGSGVVSTFLAKILGPSVLYFCSDINARACQCTLSTGAQNNVSLHVINADLARPLLPRLRRAVDVILFNPPYVPTSMEEAAEAQDLRGIQGSWAGGLDGMQVTNRFLDEVEELLSPRGRFYLVAIKQNNIPRIRNRMQEVFRLTSHVVLERRAGTEFLSILCFTRQTA